MTELWHKQAQSYEKQDLVFFSLHFCVKGDRIWTVGQQCDATAFSMINI